ncbi:hypothetical protein PF001_g4419 [Phytophthora fragariae]|uniref:Uncharacterized protein n=1 Tax=Phytophthora fragariae TaxID=53985 RepID=A0A6A4EH75_9STRA|nr:hypothetical protein PF001_g4419 [Phytophthora fragariae]
MSDNGDQDKLLRLLVDKFVKSDKTAHGTAQKLAQLAFWRDMRQELSVNEATSGLDVLDDIAEAILDETGKAGDAFSAIGKSGTADDEEEEEEEDGSGSEEDDSEEDKPPPPKKPKPSGSSSDSSGGGTTTL